MSEETEPVAPEWTNDNLLRLFASLKDSIPEKEKMISYRIGLNNVDWNKVAFPPFSPEECRQKWVDMIEKMRKLRSLTELIVEAENIVSDPLHNRTAHPEFPKKPTQPRHLYFRDVFSDLKEKNPKLEMRQTLTPLLQGYDKLPQEEKDKYEKKYAKEMREYKKKVEEFSKKNKIRVPVVKLNSPGENKKYGDMPAKPPGSGHILFLKENSQSALGGKGTEAVNALSQLWKNLSETEKAAYRTRCIELKKQYYSDLRTYLNRFDEKEQEKIIRKKNIKFPKICEKKLKVKKKLPGEPKMPSYAPYSYFAGEQLKLLKNKSKVHSDHLKGVHRAWAALSNKEKEHYQSKVNANMRRYTAELQEWFQTLKPEEQESYVKENPRKSLFLSHKKTRKHKKEEPLIQPSDSEDEILEISSDDEGKFNPFEEEEEEEEEEGEIITFEFY